jgi:hypothetical protein
MPYEKDGCKAVRGTDLALLVKGVSPDDDDEEEWVPRSVIDDDSEVYDEGHEGKIVIKSSFARSKGWTE